jgi:hypothetical protein
MGLPGKIFGKFCPEPKQTGGAQSLAERAYGRLFEHDALKIPKRLRGAAACFFMFLADTRAFPFTAEPLAVGRGRRQNFWLSLLPVLKEGAEKKDLAAAQGGGRAPAPFRAPGGALRGPPARLRPRGGPPPRPAPGARPKKAGARVCHEAIAADTLGGPRHNVSGKPGRVWLRGGLTEPGPSARPNPPKSAKSANIREYPRISASRAAPRGGSAPSAKAAKGQKTPGPELAA